MVYYDTDRQTDGQTDRQAGRHTGTQTNRHTGTQAHRHTGTQTHAHNFAHLELSFYMSGTGRTDAGGSALP